MFVTFFICIQRLSLSFFYPFPLQSFVSDSSGNALSRSSTATVAITIEDVNDNSPVLENPHPSPIDLLEVS